MSILRGRLAFMLAIVLGIIAAYAAYTYIQQQKQTPAPPEPRIKVVVAAQDIPSRTRVAAGMFRQNDIPVSAKLPDAITSIRDVEGQVTRLSISEGEQVIRRKFAVQREESGLTFVVPPSKRAVSVKVNEVIGSGGNILPGDRVDVIAVFDAKTMGKDMSATILQDVEVLAVAQTMEAQVVEAPRGAGEVVAGAVGTSPSPTPGPARAKPAPEAKSVTLAVDLEQAQRLVLAEERGSLRLALRPYKEASIIDLQEARLNSIAAPVKQGQAQITGTSISPTRVKAGDKLKVQFNVRNISTSIIKSQGPDPGFTYVQGQTFHSQNFQSRDGSYRVGINFAGKSPVPFPYRWGLGADLPPGSSVTVEGYVLITNDFEGTNYWAGLIQEPANVVQDNLGIVKITATPPNKVVVSVDKAAVRSGPDISSSIVDEVVFGTELTVLGQEADWYKIEIPKTGKQGYVTAGWIASPN
jgi:pilus assembly protein CpaB